MDLGSVESAESVIRMRGDVSVLVAGTARVPGAGIGQRVIRAAKDRLIAGVIPHVTASTRIPVPGLIGALLGPIFAAVYGRNLDPGNPEPHSRA
jgi:hypothetical protein